MKKLLKNFCKKNNQSIKGWPNFFIMMFLIIFLMQLIALVILLKQYS